MKTELLSWTARLHEAAVNNGNGQPSRATVALLSAGCGNLRDGNFYPPEVVRQAAPVFEAVRCFVDHATRAEESDRPERTVRDQCGWFSELAVADGELRATLNLAGPAADEAHSVIEAALRYRQDYPDREWAGFSINAEGPSHVEDAEVLAARYPQFRDELMRRDSWNVVDSIERATSVDLVTYPARGGKVLSMRESEATAMDENTKAKRLGVLEELQQKAKAVEDTHDPAVIAELLAALEPYLDQELEALGAEERDAGEERLTCEACGHQQTRRESESMAVRMFREAFSDDFTPAPGMSALDVFNQAFDDDVPSRPVFSAAADMFRRMCDDDDGLGVRRYGSALEAFEAGYAG